MLSYFNKHRRILKVNWKLPRISTHTRTGTLMMSCNLTCHDDGETHSACHDGGKSHVTCHDDGKRHLKCRDGGKRHFTCHDDGKRHLRCHNDGKRHLTCHNDGKTYLVCAVRDMKWNQPLPMRRGLKGLSLRCAGGCPCWHDAVPNSFHPPVFSQLLFCQDASEGSRPSQELGRGREDAGSLIFPFLRLLNPLNVN